MAKINITKPSAKWGKWLQPVKYAKGEPYRIMCDDCGLVHNVQFKIISGKICIRFRMNEQATSELRKHKTNKLRVEFENYIYRKFKASLAYEKKTKGI